MTKPRVDHKLSDILTLFFRIFMKLQTTALLLALAFLTGSCETSKIAVRKDSIQNLKTVAVMPFTTEAGISPKVAEECMESFKSIMLEAGFKLVERQAIDKIMKEKALALAGLSTGDSMELGQLLAADGLLIANITANSSTNAMGQIALSTYGSDKYDPANDKKDGTYFQINGDWYRKAMLTTYKFQIFVKLIATKDGEIALTMQNAYPEIKKETG
ncbi:MAG: hypothetical protein JNM63_04805, partial [Spirochaetia bacterium]|nr:hypothetical protein [Spirochaetia bacterium]